MKDYARFQKVMQDENRRGLTRATARDILYDDIKQGKIKSLTIEELNASREPIDYFRKIYGEDALEQLDSLADEFGQMPTVSEANKFARSKFNFTPIENRLPEATTIKEAKKAEEEFGIDKETVKVVDMPEKSLMDKIKDIFTRKKEKPAKVTNIKSEIDKRKSVDDLIDEYNANKDRLLLTDEEGGTLIGYDEFNKLNKRNEEIANVLEDKGIFSKVEEEIKPEGIVIPFKKKITEPEEKAEGGIMRSKFAKGGRGKKILDIIANANKKLKGKKSMEKVNPKTGEVTTPEKPVGIVMEPEPVIQRYNQDIIKAADEIYPSYDDPKIAADQIVDSYAQMKYGLEDQYGLSNKERMDLYTQAYDYVMDYNRKARSIYKQGEPITEIEKPIPGAFSFNDPEIKAGMEKAMAEAKKEEMRCALWD